MRFRLLGISAACAFALIVCAAASAYPWPVKPFHKQHPIRANYGDPRTIFQLPIFQDGIDGPGSFQFHNGIDIAAPDGTRVYPVMPGTVKILSGDSISVTAPGHVFQYFHIVPIVSEGEVVRASHTLLGYVAKGWEHVHLTELRGDHLWNPLAKGGIAPYRDTTKPTVSSILFREFGTLKELDPLAICGHISIATQAFDTPPMRVPGKFATLPVAPASVTWTLRKVGNGLLLVPTSTAVDFRGVLPLDPEFWNVYARGTYQNAPRFGPRQFSLMPGRFIYNLTTIDGLDTRTLPNGIYQVTVRATDIKGNARSLNQRFTVTNQPNTETGCPPPPPSPAKP